MNQQRPGLIILLSLSIACNVCAQSKNAEWHAYGRDGYAQRFVALKNINKQNVQTLKVAWTYRTGELDTYTNTSLATKAAFEATPLMIDGTLYFSTPTCRVIAVDASTGKEKWVYDPAINKQTHYSEVTSRGVSYWAHPTRKTESRIILATLDGRLIALNASSGLPVHAFGKAGAIDLRDGFGNDWSITSPPAIVNNVIVVGSSMGDNQRIDYPAGTVRGYDVQSGKLLWSWDPVPRDESDTAWHTWQGNKTKRTGAANAWAPISVDHKRNLVFVPTSSPAVDYYGGERIGQNLYGNCVVALNAVTGKRIWHFQVVHHDLWDYDIAAQPVLFDFTRNGKKIPAVAVGTKMGHIFVLNRENGEPLLPVEERPVPASDVAGEKAWPTQPFPVKPEPLGLQKISEADAWGFTEEQKAVAAERIGKYRKEGIFTPPSLAGSLMTPGNVGGIHWGGMCYDPVRNLLVTNINWLAAIIRLLPREDAAKMEADDPALRNETGAQEGTPYIMKRDYLFTADSSGRLRAQSKPPWGTLLAIDMSSGEKKWESPLGFMFDPGKYPEARQWGSINFGGAIVTASGLIFVAATMDNHFRAFDSETGKLLWEVELPAGGQATPMSYSINGKQYVVIAAGGHGKLGTKLGDHVVAYALP